MTKHSTRAVVAPAAPSITETEFQVQLSRLAEILPALRTRAQKAKTNRHPDLARVVETVEVGFSAAYAALGSHDPEAYHKVLVSLRQQIGSWRTVDSRHGAIEDTPAPV